MCSSALHRQHGEGVITRNWQANSEGINKKTGNYRHLARTSTEVITTTKTQSHAKQQQKEQRTHNKWQTWQYAHSYKRWQPTPNSQVTVISVNGFGASVKRKILNLAHEPAQHATGGTHLKRCNGHTDTVSKKVDKVSVRAESITRDEGL